MDDQTGVLNRTTSGRDKIHFEYSAIICTSKRDYRKKTKYRDYRWRKSIASIEESSKFPLGQMIQRFFNLERNDKDALSILNKIEGVLENEEKVPRYH
jgi:environmental stress-induced protein Ves